MREITCGLGGKICTLQGSSTYVTRIQPFFKHPPLSRVRIMSNDLKSIGGIFDDPLVLENYCNVEIDIIFDADVELEENLISFLESNYFVKIKRIKGIWTNLFLKEGCKSVNFDMYPFGYKQYLYHDQKNEYVENRGFTLKLYNNKLMNMLIDWFDEVWEKEELVEFEPIRVSCRNEFRWGRKDGGGKYYVNAKYLVRNCINEKEFLEKKDYNLLIKSDRFSYYQVNTRSTVYFYEDKVVFASDSEKSNNLAVEFYDKEIINHIKLLVGNAGTKGKTGIKLEMEELLTKDDISSEELFEFLTLYKDNEEMVTKMRKHYIDLYHNDGIRKFNNTLNRVHNQTRETMSKQDKHYDERETN